MKMFLDPVFFLHLFFLTGYKFWLKLAAVDSGLKLQCGGENYYFCSMFDMVVFPQLCKPLTTIFHFLLILIGTNRHRDLRLSCKSVAVR
jgi:hypothetical protein